MPVFQYQKCAHSAKRHKISLMAGSVIIKLWGLFKWLYTVELINWVIVILYLYLGLPYSDENERTVTACKNMEESHKNNVKRKDTDTKEYTPYDFIHVKLEADKNNLLYKSQILLTFGMWVVPGKGLFECWCFCFLFWELNIEVCWYLKKFVKMCICNFPICSGYFTIKVT